MNLTGISILRLQLSLENVSFVGAMSSLPIHANLDL